ncbi:MAG: hypothetical protein E6G02_00220 [Actinobacteria bacterium]|nr:MAG: hypothetical protein E6G02_00220 [Actinomycetota bacterium]
MPKLSRVALVLVAISCASVLLQVRSGHLLTVPSAAAATAGIGFETPSIADPIHTFGEPDIGIDSQGRVFVSGPTGTGTQRSVWFGSVDGGHSFRTISPGPPPSALAGTEAPPGGGDTAINFDRSGKQYYIDLYALTCDRVATTADGGATAQQNVLGCGTGPGSDRPWLAVYDPPPGASHQSAYSGPTPLVYEAYNNLDGPGPNGGSQWNKSLDGLNYTGATNADQTGTTLVTPATETTYSPFGADGYPAVDQLTGKIFQTSGFPNDDGTYDLLLNIGTPNAAGNLTFLDAPAVPGGGPDYSKLIHVADNLPDSPDVLFTVASMDTARNLFVAWAVDAGSSNPGQRQVFVSAASAASGWSVWTPPVQVSDGSTATGDAVNVFPWLKAGAVWYGSDKNVDPSGNSGQNWNVFMSQVVFPTDSSGAITGAAPSKTLVRVTPHPMHYDSICLAGTGCIASQGNRNLADFFVVTIDRSGAAEIVYDDTSNGLVQPGFTPDNLQLVDHAGAGVVTIARQSSGPGLYGKPVSGPSHAPVGGLSDSAGDARYPVIGGANVTGMDIVGSQLSLQSRAHLHGARSRAASAVRHPVADGEHHLLRGNDEHGREPAAVLRREGAKRRPLLGERLLPARAHVPGAGSRRHAGAGDSAVPGGAVRQEPLHDHHQGERSRRRLADCEEPPRGGRRLRARDLSSGGSDDQCAGAGGQRPARGRRGLLLQLPAKALMRKTQASIQLVPSPKGESS